MFEPLSIPQLYVVLYKHYACPISMQTGIDTV